MRRFIIGVALFIFFYPYTALSAGSEDGSALLTRTSARIVGGYEADPNAWQWMVSLVASYEQTPYYGHLCGGSLIHPRWVVTAAHCVNDYYGATSPDEVDAVIGVHDLKNDLKNGIGKRISVKRIITHPSYNPATHDSDIALLELSEDASEYPTVPWMSGTDMLVGKTAIAVGWGNTSATGRDFPETLQQVSLPIVSNQTCDAAYYEDITSNMMCAGYSYGGKDSCQGDSGGPLVIQDGGVWKLAGIVSWGNGCAEPGYYGVYARVSNLTNFINQYISSSNAPVVITGSASSVNSTSATFNGTVNPNGQSTTCYFEYGTTTKYGYVTTSSNVGSGTEKIPVSRVVSDLKANTTYHYRLTAKNNAGIINGADQNFTTSAGTMKPSVVTEGATSVASGSALLNGIVNPHGANTTYYFEYGMTTSYGNTTPAASAGSGTSDYPVSAKITGLKSNITYYYRLNATNSIGKSTGDAQSFITESPHPPTAEDDTAFTAKGTSVVIMALANDTDPEGDELTITGVENPLHGKAVINTDKISITYTPDSSYTGKESFGYTVSDGFYTDRGSITVTVGETSGNYVSVDTPVKIPDDDAKGASSVITVSSDGIITDVNVKINISHNWISDLSLYLTAPSGRQIMLFKDLGYNEDNFTDTLLDDEADQSITDGAAPFSGVYRPMNPLNVLNGEMAAGKWTLRAIDNGWWMTGTLNSWGLEITYAPLSENPPPVAQNDLAVTIKNTAVTIDLLANDSDPNGDNLIITKVSSPAYGTAAINTDKKTVRYTPDADYTGEDSFTYTVSDGNSTAQGIVTISVGQTCTSYTNNNSVIIPDNDSKGITSEIWVTAEGFITDVNVKLNISHRWVEDLNAYLIAPSGKEITLFENICYDEVNFTDTVLDDQADESIEQGQGPFTGSFRPVGSLSDLNDEDINGEWQLRLTDTESLIQGNLNSWEIEICYTKSHAGGQGQNLIQDGGFEDSTAGGGSCWINSSALFETNIYQGDFFSHYGDGFVWFSGGDSDGGAETALISQSLTIPKADKAMLNFWLQVYWADLPFDMNVQMDDQVIFTATEADSALYYDWTEIMLDVSQFADDNSHELKFRTDISEGDGTTDIFLDDVSLIADTVTGNGETEVVQDGGFENGTDSAWNDYSTLFGINIYNDSGYAHSGEWLVWFAGGSDYNGADAAFVEQEITISDPEKSVLRFWLQIYYWLSPGVLKVKMDDHELFFVTDSNTRFHDKWVEVVLDVSPFADGKPHKLRFEADILEGEESTDIILDDVSIASFNLADAISVLKVLVGMDMERYVDVNNDKKMGMEDVVYILQKISEVR